MSGPIHTHTHTHARTRAHPLHYPQGATAGQIIAEMGWFNLFTRGLPLRIIMIGTLTGLQWMIYDAVRACVGVCVCEECQPAHSRRPHPS